MLSSARLATRRWLPLIILLTVGGVASSVSAAPKPTLDVEGTPKTTTVHGKTTAYQVNAETGLTLDASGPAAMVLQFWASGPTTSLVVLLTRDERYVSRNTLKFRTIDLTGRGGHNHVALLSFKIPADKHKFRIQVLVGAGADVAVVPQLARSVLRPFAAARERDMTERGSDMLSQATGNNQPEAAKPTPKTEIEELPAENAPGNLPAGPTTGTVVAGNPEEGESASVDMFDDAAWGGSSAPAGSSNVDQATKRLETSDNTLAIGGMLFLRGTANITRDDGHTHYVLSSPTLADAYMDATPTDDIRAYIRGRITYDPTLPADQQQIFNVVQLWLKFTIAHSLFVTIGEQYIKWGTGRFRNAVDFLARQRRDPFTLFDERPGVPLLKMHLPLQELGWNLYAVGTYANLSTFNDFAGAARLEMVFGSMEINSTVYAKTHARAKYGLDMSASLPLIDIFGELVMQQGGAHSFWTGSFDSANGVLPVAEHHNEQWFAQVIAGAEAFIHYSDEDAVTVGVEYFYDQLGYSNSSLYPWLLETNQYTPFFLGRHYAGAYITLPSPGPLADTTFLLNTLGNLSDGSWLSRLETRISIENTVTLSILSSLHWGRPGEFRLGFDVPQNAALAITPIHQNTPYIDLSIRALMNL